MLLNFLKLRKNQLKRYKKTGKVLARRAVVGESVQTKLNGHVETSVRIAKLGEWLVSNIDGVGEFMLIDDVVFRKRYDTEQPLKAEHGFSVYSPKSAIFYGLQYPGDEITFAPPSWVGATQTILPGYMLGGPDLDHLDKDFYGIDAEVFRKTYKAD
jgi:hypothetical protein